MQSIRFFRTLAIMLTGASLLFGCRGLQKGSPKTAAAEAEAKAEVKLKEKAELKEKAKTKAAVADAKTILKEFVSVLAVARPAPACGLFDLGFMATGEAAPLEIKGDAKDSGTGTFNITKSTTKPTKEVTYAFKEFSPNSNSKYTLSTATGANGGINIKNVQAVTATKTSSGTVSGTLLLTPKSKTGNRYQIKFGALHINNTEQNCGKTSSIDRPDAAAIEKAKTDAVKFSKKGRIGSFITLSYQEEQAKPYKEIAIIFNGNDSNDEDPDLLGLLFTNK